MRFSELLTRAGIRPAAVEGDAEVHNVVCDSRQARNGSCFVAIRGPLVDGHAYIGQAVAAGASAVVCQDASAAPSGVCWAKLDDTAAAAGAIAQAMLDWPARKMTLVGVTGTKGKTTFTHLVRHIFEQAGLPTALLGTIRHEFGSIQVPANNTTPGPCDLAALMDEMHEAGATHLVMEVSSHALDQGRAAGLDFAVAAFTNLTGDHLDYHHTMDSYLAAKRKLFESLKPSATAVLNRDDPTSESIAEATRAKKLWYGLSPAADLRARIDAIDASGTRFDLMYGDAIASVHTPMLGRHNVMNCLAAAGSCLALGLSLGAVAEALSRPLAVPGRLERVPSDAPFEVLVDYGHTDDALDNALSAVRPLTTARLIVMFGCGGDRDRTKRPRMARVAQARADVVIVTSDNPRTEDPLKIIDDILAGFDAEGREKLTVAPDRRKAIALAIGQARDGDIVVLAGKGHEDYQVIGTTKSHFDDREIASEILAARFARPGGEGAR